LMMIMRKLGEIHPIWFGFFAAMAIIGCIDGGKDDVFFSYVEVSFIIFFVLVYWICLVGWLFCTNWKEDQIFVVNVIGFFCILNNGDDGLALLLA
jgi:hypothetical protein